MKEEEEKAGGTHRNTSRSGKSIILNKIKKRKQEIGRQSARLAY